MTTYLITLYKKGEKVLSIKREGRSMEYCLAAFKEECEELNCGIAIEPISM